MKTVNFKIKENMPTTISCIGSCYDETKELSLGELLLHIESKLMELSNNHFESSVRFKVVLTELEVTKENRFVVLIGTNDYSSYLQISSEVEDVLWSFNKQVLYQTSGRFYSHYVRFTYSIKMDSDRKTTLKQVS